MIVDIGLDLVEVSDVAAAIDGPTGARYLARILTGDEVDECRTAAGIDPARLAARFAAKEAAIKALPTGDDGVSMREIEVRCDATGRPRLSLHGHVAALVTEAGAVDLSLSLTYRDGFAAAFVVAKRGSLPG